MAKIQFRHFSPNWPFSILTIIFYHQNQWMKNKKVYYDQTINKTLLFIEKFVKWKMGNRTQIMRNKKIIFKYSYLKERSKTIKIPWNLFFCHRNSQQTVWIVELKVWDEDQIIYFIWLVFFGPSRSWTRITLLNLIFNKKTDKHPHKQCFMDQWGLF